MNLIKELQELLITESGIQPYVVGTVSPDTIGIIVLKHYRHHKQLSVELYKAGTTLDGRIKNPLTPINPLDAALTAGNAKELKFYSAVSRFQNNPTLARSPLDIESLKQIVRNPLEFRFYLHNPEFSDKVVAGSLVGITQGAIIRDIELTIRKVADQYQIIPSLKLKGASLALNTMRPQFDYFLVQDNQFHLLAKYNLVKLVKFFYQQTPLLTIPQHKFKEFQQQVLSRLETEVSIRYDSTVEEAETVEAGRFEGSIEPLIYLSDLENYVMINPVMRYGGIEIPVRSKKQLYLPDDEGKIRAFQRNDTEEDRLLALLLKQHPDFLEQLDYDLSYFYLGRQTFLDENWFLNAFAHWREAGIQVLGFNKLKGNKLNSHKASITIRVNSGLNWFNTDIQVRFGKKKATLKELQRAVKNRNKFVQLDDGTQGILPGEWLKKFEGYFKAAEIAGEELHTPRINFYVIRQLYKEDQLDAGLKEELETLDQKLQHPETFPKVLPPAELKATLRTYQIEGLNWLNVLDDLGFGGCLADDMGLGKTVQILAFILLQRQKVSKNCNLVVVPTSLIFNWQDEVRKFSPSLKILTLYGADRIRSMTQLEHYELVLTSYGTLLSDSNFLSRFSFNYIFLDESQQIKNIDSQRYQAVCSLKARNRIVITGTPLENNTLDLYAQLSFACPGLLGNRQEFRDLFSIPVDKFKSSRRASELQQKVAPFILRRTKKEVAPELPQKTELTLFCPMGEAQRKVYDVYEKELRDYILRMPDADWNRETIHVLRGMTRLRQICNSPLLLEDEQLFGDRSSKIETLLEQIGNKSPDHKILVFSQFVSMLDLIKKELEIRQIPFEYLTGSTKNREGVVHRFQNDPAVRVFLISLKAGGTGLNLTQADYVYLVDPWWNPAVENQAIDRLYRIGQEKHVMAIRLICPGTLEEKIQKLQETKRTLTDEVIKSGNSILEAIDKKSWLELLQPD
ncbi:MAG TPA: SNF2-related protein [Flavisolibacter sp.]|nr:SNF2-related protein [Flavisolibacter sp.]